MAGLRTQLGGRSLTTIGKRDSPVGTSQKILGVPPAHGRLSGCLAKIHGREGIQGRGFG